MSGKDGGFPLPAIIDPPRVCVRLNIPNEREHIAAFWGALWLLTYWNQWRRDEDHTGAAVGLVWKDVIQNAWLINEGYEGCEGGIMFDVRQNDENPCVLEKSEDGGAWQAWANLQLCKPSLKIIGGVPVWVNPATELEEPFDETPPEQPSYPPRAPRPETSDDIARCNAAAAAAQIFATTAREAANQFNAGGELSLMLLFIGLIFLPLGIAITIGLALAAIASDLLSLVLGVPASEVTPEIEEELQCIIYCNTTISGGVISVNLPQIIGELNAKSVGADAYALLRAIIETLEEGGMLAALDVQGVEGDCSACECVETWCHEIDFKVTNGGFVSANQGGGSWGSTWASGTGWRNVSTTSNGIRYPLGVATTITRIELTIEAGNNNTTLRIAKQPDERLLTDVIAQVSQAMPTITYEGEANADTDHELGLFRSGSVKSNIIYVKVEGVGVNPFPSNNCE